ncbi:MAG TPA: DUF4350 domain-containing protein [Gemmatimonadaceae bacterium]
MSFSLRIGSRQISAKTALLALLGLAVAGALFTPEEATPGIDFSSYSTSPSGTRIMFELAQRMGWSASRRRAAFASGGTPAVQVVVGPGEALGAREAHGLLENVRRGGGLIFTVDDAPEIADSLGIVARGSERRLVRSDDDCLRRQSSVDQRLPAALAPAGQQLSWRRPAPGPVTQLATGYSPRAPRSAPVAVGVPLGAGRIVAISSADLMTNDALRSCIWGADIVAARALEYVRPAGTSSPLIVFDEFHHGYGIHGGSMKAVSLFLSQTHAGRFLAQALVAAVLLLFAAAPRPIVPKESARIARRSPLEHADALAHAYSEVGATRTATARLVDGLRRRAGRMVPAARKAGSSDFLNAVASRHPSLAPKVAIARRGLDVSLPPRELVAVGDAIATIEHALLTSTSTKS